MATIKQVAQKAGLSVSCVSKYLNHPDNVLPETKERIDAVIAELQYVPSNLARSLRTRRTFIIVAVMERITNPFFAGLFDNIRKYMDRQGYITVLQTVSKHVYRSTDFSFADGILICFPDDEADIEKIRAVAKKVPMVLLHGHNVSYDIPRVLLRVGHGSVMAMEYLMGRGCRNFLSVSGPADSSMTVEKTGAILSYLKEQKEHTNFRVINVVNNYEGGYAAGLSLSEQLHGADAILCDSDALAYGVISALQEQGYSVPADVLVVGYDDIILSKMYAPALTTIAIPTEQICKAACEMLLAVIDETEVNTVWFEPKLVVRAST